jgi:hypothetical protein
MDHSRRRVVAPPRRRPGRRGARLAVRRLRRAGRRAAARTAAALGRARAGGRRGGGRRLCDRHTVGAGCGALEPLAQSGRAAGPAAHVLELARAADGDGARAAAAAGVGAGPAAAAANARRRADPDPRPGALPDVLARLAGRARGRRDRAAGAVPRPPDSGHDVGGTGLLRGCGRRRERVLSRGFAGGQRRRPAQRGAHRAGRGARAVRRHRGPSARDRAGRCRPHPPAQRRRGRRTGPVRRARGRRARGAHAVAVGAGRTAGRRWQLRRAAAQRSRSPRDAQDEPLQLLARGRPRVLGEAADRRGHARFPGAVARAPQDLGVGAGRALAVPGDGNRAGVDRPASALRLPGRRGCCARARAALAGRPRPGGGLGRGVSRVPGARRNRLGLGDARRHAAVPRAGRRGAGRRGRAPRRWRPPRARSAPVRRSCESG